MVQSQPQANSSRDPISKNPFTKKSGEVAKGVGQFKLQYCYLILSQPEKKKKKD
jgi:hypothetical protein